MHRIRVGLCLTLLIASAAAVEAGSRKNRGCGYPAYSCAAPLSCAAPASCAMPSCAGPLNYGCAAPSCAAPLSCAAPMNCAAPTCAGPAFAAAYGGAAAGYDFDGFGPYGVNPFNAAILPVRYPTRGITPAVIPGDELVW